MSSKKERKHDDLKEMEKKKCKNTIRSMTPKCFD